MTRLIFDAKNVNQIVGPAEVSAIEEVGSGEIDLELSSSFMILLGKIWEP